jgi:hypothetical protein
MAKIKDPTKLQKRLPVPKRTSQGRKHMPKNKHARRRWKMYHRQGPRR